MSKNSEKAGMYVLSVRNKMAIVIWADNDQAAIDKANYKKNDIQVRKCNIRNKTHTRGWKFSGEILCSLCNYGIKILKLVECVWVNFKMGILFNV
jgi:hypothetical protein